MAGGYIKNESSRIGVALLGLLFLGGLYIWSTRAPKFFLQPQSALTKHSDHAPWILLHVVAGSPALLAGPFLLWSGAVRRKLSVHRWLGRVYVFGGALGVLGGVVLSITAGHGPPAFSLGTFVLGLLWWTAAAIAYREIRNRRYGSHREWMIRSYILTFSFVVCRIPASSLLAWMGPGADIVILWAGWSLPLFLAEVFFQWERTAGATVGERSL